MRMAGNKSRLGFNVPLVVLGFLQEEAMLPLKAVVSKSGSSFTRIYLHLELPIVPCFLLFLELSLAIGTFHHSDHLLFFLNQAKTFLF